MIQGEGNASLCITTQCAGLKTQWAESRVGGNDAACEEHVSLWVHFLNFISKMFLQIYIDVHDISFIQSWSPEDDFNVISKQVCFRKSPHSIHQVLVALYPLSEW